MDARTRPAERFFTWDSFLDGPPGAVIALAAPGGPPLGIAFLCPGCRRLLTVPLCYVALPFSGYLAWNGDARNPSIETPIADYDGCRWRGYLQNGTWRPENVLSERNPAGSAGV